MKVYYDDQIFRYQTTGGIKNYFINLIQIFLQHPEIGIEPIFSEYVRNILNLELNSKIVKPSKGELVLELLRKRYLRDAPLDVDLVHHTFYFKSYLGLYKDIPIVSTIHDMIPEKLPDRFFANPHFYKDLYIKNSDHLITVSDTTKIDLTNIHPCVVNKTKTIHLGYSSLDSQTLNFDNTDYFIYVGKRSSYKSINDLFHAFAIYPNSNNARLLLVGGGKLSYSEIILLKNLKISDKVYHSTPNNNQLTYLIKNAISLICTSEEEGFHIPTLDALNLGVPVIVRDIPIFKELYGENILKFKTSKDLSMLMLKIQNDNYKLPDIFKTQVKSYSWINCAKKTADLYKLSVMK